MLYKFWTQQIYMNNSTSFFRKIRAICRTMKKGEWRFHFNTIRCENHCPITFVLDKELGYKTVPHFVFINSLKLYLTYDETLLIVRAADEHSFYLSTNKNILRMRRILLKAANLQESSKFKSTIKTY